MRHFLRAHHAGSLLVGSILLMIVAWGWRGTTLPVPQLLEGRTAPVAIEMLLGALYAPLVAHSFGGVALRMEHCSRRRLLGPDLLLVGLALVPVVVVCVIATALGDGVLGASLARNAMFFVGAALLVLSTFGQSAAVAVPIAYFFVVSLLGGRPGGSAEWWAVVRGPANSASVIAAVCLVIAASTIFHLRARQAAALRPV